MELLVVIVVIAILASITIVAFTGIQREARNTLRIDTAKKAIDAAQVMLTFNDYATVRASLHEEDYWARACIGIGYPDVNGDGDGDCGIFGGNPNVSESSAFTQLLNNGVNLSNVAQFPTISTESFSLLGPYFQSAYVDGVDGWTVEYTLEDEQRDCRLRPLVYHNGDGTVRTSPVPAGSEKWTFTGEGTTQCNILVWKP